MGEWTPERHTVLKMWAKKDPVGRKFVIDALSEIERINGEYEEALDKLKSRRENYLTAIDRLIEKENEIASLKELMGELVKAGNFMHDAVERFTKEPNWEMLRKWRALIQKAQEVVK